MTRNWSGRLQLEEERVYVQTKQYIEKIAKGEAWHGKGRRDPFETVESAVGLSQDFYFSYGESDKYFPSACI